jgi:epsin
LDYLLQHGSEQVIAYTKENLYVVKTLKEFQYIDDEGRDQGINGIKQ